jgi:hypothetical protein
VLVVADEQILKGVAATISAQFVDQHGDPVEPGTVTVGVTAADGSVVLAAGTSTTTSTGLTGVRQRALTAAHAANLGILTATWTDGTSTVTTRVEVVGAYYASTREIVAADASLNNPSKYPPPRIQAARRLVETEFENICGVAFVPRYRRAWLCGNGDEELLLPDPMLRAVRSVRVYSDATTYSTFTAGELAAIPPNTAGRAVRTDRGYWPRGDDNIVVEYEHGYDLPPAPVRGAFLTRIRDVLNRENRGIPDRTSTFSAVEGGTYSLIVPGQRGSMTGIPDVDVVLNDPAYNHRRTGFA